MNIRPAHNSDAPVAKYDPEAGVTVLSPEGENLWTVRLKPDGSLVIKCGSSSNLGETVIADSIQISPVASNYILLTRPALVFPTSSK